VRSCFPASVPARIVIADDHALARTSLRSLLATEPAITVIGEVGSGAALLEFCRAEQPDLVLLDIRMPDMDGIAATTAIAEAHTHTGVIIITMHDHPFYRSEARRAGARGFVLKDATLDEFLDAIKEALAQKA